MKEQIEEMAKSVDEALIHNVSWNSNNGVIAYSAEGIARELFDDGYHKQEWISVEDRLPERKGRYLVYIPNEPLICCMYYDGDASVYGDNGVTHWMPLPEPPKMKGGAE